MRLGVLAFIVVGLLLDTEKARAELVYLRTGRAVSVQSLQVLGDTAILTLRSGGEIVCPRAMIAEVLPDEVPYPEPASALEAAPALVSAVPRPSPGVTGDRLPSGRVPFGDLIKRSSSAHGVDPRLVQAVIHVESRYQRSARSRKGAMGLMQLMPDTARRYALRRPFDPAANIDAGTRHLRWLLDRYPLTLALAAYNAGEAAVERFQGIPPYTETRDYVSRILQLIEGPADKQ